MYAHESVEYNVFPFHYQNTLLLLTEQLMHVKKEEIKPKQWTNSDLALEHNYYYHYYYYYYHYYYNYYYYLL